MLPCYCSGTEVKNIENNTVTAITDTVGPHKQRMFAKLFDVNHNLFIPQTYYNNCACNEMRAILERHIIPRLEDYDPINPVLKQHRELLYEFSEVCRNGSEEWGRYSFEQVIEKTVQAKKNRYKKAFNNIINRNKYFGVEDCKLETFVKFEPFPEIKTEQKPPRLIQFRPFDFTYCMKSFCGVFDKLKETTTQLPNGQQLRQAFTKYLTDDRQIEVVTKAWGSYKRPNALLIDMKSFDGHYDIELLKNENGFWKNLFKSRFLSFLLKSTENNRARTHNNIHYKFKGKRCSGEYTTSTGNSLTNWFMLYCYMVSSGIKDFHIFVNGDDSIIIFESSDIDKLLDPSFFHNFNMEAEMECVEELEQIEYCQRKMVKLSNTWRWVRKPERVISRFPYTDSKYINCASRYLLGKALCELSQNRGVPMLQEYCLSIIRDNLNYKPLGCVDKVPALNATQEKRGIQVEKITMEDRVHFERTFNIPVYEQIHFEECLRVGQSVNDPNLQKFLNKYKFFIYN